jgi:hypothetical protein
MRHKFSWFSSVFKQILRWFPNTKFLLHASQAALQILNSSKLSPVIDAPEVFVFQIIDKIIRNSKRSEATSYYHNVFTFTLFLPEGRAGVAWEPSNKMTLFLPPPLGKESVSHLTPWFTLCIYSSGIRFLRRNEPTNGWCLGHAQDSALS